MKLNEKQLKQLKTKLALEGTGSKKKLADSMKCKQSQLSYILLTGMVSSSLEFKIIDYLK